MATNRGWRLLRIVLPAFAGFFVLMFWQARQGLSLWDEGFLWYGAQRVTSGEVPMRDFMSYDIGRYYWSAAFMTLMGSNGIVALRAASTMFQIVALTLGLVMLGRSAPRENRLYWLLAALTIVAWMAPQYRLFDASIAIVLVAALAFLVERPTLRRYALAGVAVGLGAVFGKNHGLYGAVASVGVIAYLAMRRDSRPAPLQGLACWGSGVVVGYLPVLAMLVAVPGFAHEFWESIHILFERSSTNLPLPFPWPWRVRFGEIQTQEMLRDLTNSFFFIAIVAFAVPCLAWAVRRQLRREFVSPAVVASVFLALPYAHYAYSRADLAHLAPAIPPFLMGVFAVLCGRSSKVKWLSASLLCAGSLFAMLPEHPRWFCAVFSDTACVDVTVDGDVLRIDARTANNLEAIHTLAEQFAPGNRTFLAVPFWPGAYAALGRKSPMWEIYGLFRRSEAFQRTELARIEAADPGFVLIYDRPLYQRDDLFFRNTHPVIDQYVREHFERIEGYSRSPNIRVYRSRRDILSPASGG